jgi:hypothetical protein
VVWVGSQLQHLQLPGKPSATAAALAALHEQQQQVRQQLEAAVQQFQDAVPSCRAAKQQQVAAGSNGSSCAVSDVLGYEDGNEQDDVTGANAAAAAAADGSITTQSLQVEAEVPAVLVSAESVAELVLKAGSALPQQLQAFGGALWPLLPQPRCCSNWGCVSMSAVSEVRLAAKASRCSSCKVARWVRLGRGWLSSNFYLQSIAWGRYVVSTQCCSIDGTLCNNATQLHA